MNVENQVYPDGDQIAALRSAKTDGGPIVMVNLLKFRAKAQYADGRDPELSGREAYDRYAIAVTKLLHEVGGSIVYAGDVSYLTIGHVATLWDEVALAQYPSRAALFQMATSAAYQEIACHRDAGLEGQLNIETVPTLAAQLAKHR